MAGRTRYRVHPAVPAVIAVVVCAALIALIATRADEPDARLATPSVTEPVETSTTTSTAPGPTTTTTIPPVPLADALVEDLALEEPRSYVVEWDLVENELGSSETWEVRRPYEIRVVKVRDGERLSGTIASSDALWNLFTDRNGWIKIEDGRHRAPYDGRFTASVPFLMSLGVVDEVGADEVLGRACTVYRTGAPLATSPTALGDGTVVDFCIDDEGLLLRENWTNDGDPVVDRVVRAVAAVPDLAAETFEPEAIGENSEEFDALLLGRSIPLSDSMRGLLAYELTVPDGWVVDEEVQRGGSSAGVREATNLIAYVSDGIDLVEIRQVFNPSEVPIASKVGVPVIVDGWDEGFLTASYTDITLRLKVDESIFIEIVATSTRDLLTFVDAIAPTPADAADEG